MRLAFWVGWGRGWECAETALGARGARSATALRAARPATTRRRRRVRAMSTSRPKPDDRRTPRALPAVWVGASRGENAGTPASDSVDLGLPNAQPGLAAAAGTATAGPDVASDFGTACSGRLSSAAVRSSSSSSSGAGSSSASRRDDSAPRLREHSLAQIARGEQRARRAESLVAVETPAVELDGVERGTARSRVTLKAPTTVERPRALPRCARMNSRRATGESVSDSEFESGFRTNAKCRACDLR